MLPRWLATFAPPTGSPFELAAEAIAVKIRWVGLVVGFLLANFGPSGDSVALNVMLGLGVGFTAINTAVFRGGRVFLRDHPLIISAMEALFIGLLCYSEAGLDSPFRFYYLLSLICCAIRYSPRITFLTCGLDILSYAVLNAVVESQPNTRPLFLLTVVVLIWATWAAGAMARLLKRAENGLRIMNLALTENQGQLESRIAERTRELEESQAQVLHQEKMAAFGLLAAGIAHEVGNPLTSISGIVQMLERRDPDEYTRTKLGIVTGQLARIQNILRELITFSRPASALSGKVATADVISEALGIAKYYKGGKNRNIVSEVPSDLPAIVGVRDQLVQVIFNLVLNAIDATGKGGNIVVGARREGNRVEWTVVDDGIGIDPAEQARLFRPYFTTKKQGTGLGLFVTRRIVEAHGGMVGVESESGRGTTFRVSLPVKVDASTRAGGVSPPWKSSEASLETTGG